MGDGSPAHGRRVEQLLHALGIDAREHLLDADQHAEHAIELLDDRRCHLHDRAERNAHAHVLHHRRLHEQHLRHDAYAVQQRVERFHVFRVIGFEQRLVLLGVVIERVFQQRLWV